MNSNIFSCHCWYTVTLLKIINYFIFHTTYKEVPKYYYIILFQYWVLLSRIQQSNPLFLCKHNKKRQKIKLCLVYQQNKIYIKIIDHFQLFKQLIQLNFNHILVFFLCFFMFVFCCLFFVELDVNVCEPLCLHR